MDNVNGRDNDAHHDWSRPPSSGMTSAQTEEEQFELVENNELLQNQSDLKRKKSKYQDGSSIDWVHEESIERIRLHGLRSAQGARGILLPALDSTRTWFILILTGIGIGVTGAWLDVLVKWLSDLREGRCAYGLFYNQVACCSGLDPGEVCEDWLTWSQSLGIHSLFGQSLLQAFVYIALAIVFSSSAAVLVLVYAPYAFHTGIPEIKAILGGYVLDAFLAPWTLLIKSLGLVLAVASGLSLGKEGPLVHVTCCMANLILSFFKKARSNEAQKRRLLAAAATAGISVAFGSPLGGVLFGLEELDTFASESDVMWKGFVTSVIAAVTLQYIDPFGTAKLVLFQVNSVSETWRGFELLPWLFLSVVGGVLGSLLIKLNVAIAIYRRNSILHELPVLEVVGATAVTAAASYLVLVLCTYFLRRNLRIFTSIKGSFHEYYRVQASELVANLFQDCDATRPDYHGLCNPNATIENVFLLTLTAAAKIGFTAWTFGMMIPAGIFLPTIAIGACLGRAVGLVVQALHRSYPHLWFFSSCPPDITVRCISPGFYAVIGASAMLGGVTRMTVSLVVILFELTGALSHVLPIMISVMVSKWVADAFGKEGIYSSWIAMRRYPWLPPTEYRDEGEIAADIMVPYERLEVINARGILLHELENLFSRSNQYGFPVLLEDRELQGFITRERVKTIIGILHLDSNTPHRPICTFMREDSDGSSKDFYDLLDPSPMELNKQVPQELVVSIFQRMNLQYIIFTDAGRLTGLVTKSDIVSLMTQSSSFGHAGALADEKF